MSSTSCTNTADVDAKNQAITAETLHRKSEKAATETRRKNVSVVILDTQSVSTTPRTSLHHFVCHGNPLLSNHLSSHKRHRVNASNREPNTRLKTFQHWLLTCRLAAAINTMDDELFDALFFPSTLIGFLNQNKMLLEANADCGRQVRHDDDNDNLN